MSSESESESEASDYSFASSTQEKLTKQESALVYAHQMNTMVDSFGHFLTQMKELSGGGGSGSRKRREVHTSTRVGGADQSHAMAENGGQENLSSSNGIPPRGFKNGLPSSYSAGNGNNIPEPSSTSTASSFSVPNANALTNKACCCNDTLNKKVDVMFGFVQTLFGNHLQLLGKCYQDQMETHRRLDEMRSMTEDYDEELEYLEQQFLALKKSSDDVKFSISKLSESKSVTKDCVVAIDKISDQILQLRKYILAAPTSTSCARAPAPPPVHDKKGEKNETVCQTTYAKVKAGLNSKPTSTVSNSKGSNAAEGVAETNGMSGAGDANIDLELD